jgi:hypothetical protein
VIIIYICKFVLYMRYYCVCMNKKVKNLLINLFQYEGTCYNSSVKFYYQNLVIIFIYFITRTHACTRECTHAHTHALSKKTLVPLKFWCLVLSLISNTLWNPLNWLTPIFYRLWSELIITIESIICNFYFALHICIWLISHLIIFLSITWQLGLLVDRLLIGMEIYFIWHAKAMREVLYFV